MTVGRVCSPQCRDCSLRHKGPLLSGTRKWAATLGSEGSREVVEREQNMFLWPFTQQNTLLGAWGDLVGREKGSSQVITGQWKGERPHRSTLLTTTNSSPFCEPTLTCHCYQNQGWLWYMYYMSYKVYKGHLNFKMLYQVTSTSCLHAGIWSGLSFH